MAKIIRQKTILLIFTFIVIFLLSCSKKIIEVNGTKVYNLGLFENAEIIVPKPQIAQSLSIIVKNIDGGLLIFDGGRVEDADYLHKIILDNGGVVDAWFLTHIHDDHIGALYQILKDGYDDMTIKNLYYSFADFEWYYDKIGNDAGALVLFENELKKYSDKINIHNDISKGEVFTYKNVEVEVLNNMYKLDSDPINNTTIVYKVYIDDKSMIVLGDLGYEGGEKLASEVSPLKLKSDIVTMSHHGQGGVSEKVYYYIEPKIAIWPTTYAIYNNTSGKYDTDRTKDWIESLKVKYNILTYEGDSIIK